MFPFNRFGIIHFIRILIEILLIMFLHIFGSYRSCLMFGFNNSTSIIYTYSIILMTSTDIYDFLLIIFSSENPKRIKGFHTIFYSIMSLLSLMCCVFSLIGYVYCVPNGRMNSPTYQSCHIFWSSIICTFFLSLLYSASAKLLCCLHGQNLE